MRSFALICALLGLAFAQTAVAQATGTPAATASATAPSDSLVASEVNVDATAKDAAAARGLAMAKGEIDALIGLLGKLVPPNIARELVANLGANDVTKMVISTEVLDERITSNRYRARLRVSFDGSAVSALVAKASGTGEAEGEVASSTSSFLILPQYEENGVTLLWDEKNPWREVWKNIALENISGDIVVAYGDQRDAAMVNPSNLTTVTYTQIAPITVRYGVSDIIVLQAKMAGGGQMALSVIQRRLTRSRNEVNLLTYRADLQETREALLTRAARDIVRLLKQKKAEELANTQKTRAGQRSQKMMLATISTLASWTSLRKKLETLPMLDSIDTLAIGPRQIDLMITYRGSEESLANALESNEIRLVKKENYWVISRD